MKSLSIKSIVSIANIILYTALLLVFLVLGINKINLDPVTTYKICYVLVGFGIVLFVIYHVVRIHELKKTTFQLTKKHLVYMQIFYIGQYIIFGITLLYLILANTNVLNQTGINIFWYVWFPIVFVLSIAISILESIVRVEEKIFLVKKAWKDSADWEEAQLKAKNDSPFTSVKSKNPNANPFLDDSENKTKE
ncbi:hypothetical protein SSYRP_v1c07590 [Spiroplasma syrphidicola EA-1]|uniref:Transmembrane protein n=1 Tax=Spiroplasma syrphidicola EA-1 TaxID=1276229 RepID=R4UEJ4_9MOLU|nr:hypothetical protein [Spiroplasma syrphidicola]AGM26349.1 hypothetical protein SSYRP_v1c07590 [Spiroplasma syrphidicola EA-1]